MARQRDAHGRFIKGHKGVKGAGRPPLDREREYWSIARTTCSLSDWRAVVNQAVSDAKSGDTAARTWLTSILVGSPDKLRERADADAQAQNIETAADVAAVLAAELAAVGKFPNDPRRNALVARVSDALLRALEVGDLSEQLQRIEALLSNGGKDDGTGNDR